MDELEVLQRYALALTAVPDEDVAGDLFMDASSDSDLLRRANAWRRGNGLEPIDMPATLPALSLPQQEHARYLASRGKRRRRARRALTVAAACLLLLGAVGLGIRGAAPKGLSIDPAFQGEALQSGDLPDGRKLSIYKAEASTTEITVWWELRGPGAGQMGGRIVPAAQPEGGSYFADPASNEVTAARRDRLLGKSAYQVLVTVADTVTLRLPDQVQITAPLEQVDSFRTLALNQEAKIGESVVIIEELVVGRNSTEVIYRTETGARDPRHLPQIVNVQADGRTYRVTPRVTAADGKLTTSFAPLRPGTTGLSLEFVPPPDILGSMEFPLPQSEGDLSLRREKNIVRASVSMTDGTAVPQAMPYFTDSDGTSYQASLRFFTGRTGAFMELAAVIPPNAQLVALVLPDVVRHNPIARVSVDLSPLLAR